MAQPLPNYFPLGVFRGIGVLQVGKRIALRTLAGDQSAVLFHPPVDRVRLQEDEIGFEVLYSHKTLLSKLKYQVRSQAERSFTFLAFGVGDETTVVC
jgi:hypothetical protein